PSIPTPTTTTESATRNRREPLAPNDRTNEESSCSRITEHSQSCHTGDQRPSRPTVPTQSLIATNSLRGSSHSIVRLPGRRPRGEGPRHVDFRSTSIPADSTAALTISGLCKLDQGNIPLGRVESRYAPKDPDPTEGASGYAETTVQGVAVWVRDRRTD